MGKGRYAAIAAASIALLSFIHVYNRAIKSRCNDVLNLTLFEHRFKVCLWNIGHVVAFYAVSAFLKPETPREYFSVFCLGIAWFAAENAMRVADADRSECDSDVVYENVTRPRYDDVAFNVLGQLLYKLQQGW